MKPILAGLLVALGISCMNPQVEKNERALFEQALHEYPIVYVFQSEAMDFSYQYHTPTGDRSGNQSQSHFHFEGVNLPKGAVAQATIKNDLDHRFDLSVEIYAGGRLVQREDNKFNRDWTVTATYLYR